MKTYNVSRLPSQIVLGWDGENNWRPIAFDCSALLTGRSDAVVTLWLLPKGAAQAFPVALERDGNVVTWTPLNEEMTAEHGQLQIVVQDGTDVGKSKVVDYTVHDSLVSGADHPAETPSWATQVVADVTEQADRAEEAAESIGESIGEQLPGAIADYLEEHPVIVTETDPTVPSWAKQPQKPTYTAAEVHALPDSTAIPTKTSDLQNDSGFLTQHQSLAAYRTASAQDTIDAAQDAAIAAKYSKPSGGIPASDLASAVQTSLGKADTALQSAPVSSVNGKTGAVVLDASDVGALPADTPIPTKTSDLTNDSGFQTAPFAVNVYKENESWHCSATPAQLVANAKNCYITSIDDGDVGRYFPSMAEVAEDGSSAFLSCIIPLDSGGAGDWSFDLIAISWYDGEDVVVQVETIAASNNAPSAPGVASAGSSWDYARGDHRHPKELPAVTSTDNGKFLRVVSGAWTAQAVPAAESNSFGGGS